MTRSAVQFSVFLVHKPGIPGQVCSALAREKVNLVALTMMDSNEHGVLRLVAEDAAKARAALKKLNLPISETEVVLAELSNRPGALADVCSRLDGDHIAINYAYCTGSSGNGRSLAVLKVSDLKRALGALDGRKPKRRDPGVLTRPVRR